MEERDEEIADCPAVRGSDPRVPVGPLAPRLLGECSDWMAAQGYSPGSAAGIMSLLVRMTGGCRKPGQGSAAWSAKQDRQAALSTNSARRTVAGAVRARTWWPGRAMLRRTPKPACTWCQPFVTTHRSPSRPAHQRGFGAGRSPRLPRAERGRALLRMRTALRLTCEEPASAALTGRLRGFCAPPRRVSPVP